jgi:hypothetical protein
MLARPISLRPRLRTSRAARQLNIRQSTTNSTSRERRNSRGFWSGHGRSFQSQSSRPGGPHRLQKLHWKRKKAWRHSMVCLAEAHVLPFQTGRGRIFRGISGTQRRGVVGHPESWEGLRPHSGRTHPHQTVRAGANCCSLCSGTKRSRFPGLSQQTLKPRVAVGATPQALLSAASAMGQSHQCARGWN